MSESLDLPYIAILPYNVIKNKSIEANAKIHYGCLVALSKREGYCWASDDQLAEMHGVHKRQIKRWHNSLEEYGHIKRVMENRPYRTEDGRMLWKTERKIYVCDGFSRVMSESDKNVTLVGGDKNVTLVGGDKNVTLNKEYINNQSLKKEYSSDSQVCSSEPRAESLSFSSEKKEEISSSCNQNEVVEKSQVEKSCESFYFSHQERKFVKITNSDIDCWRKAFPEIDIHQEIAKAEQWLLSNPSKSRKKNWRKFLVGWFDRTNDRKENQKAYSSNKNLHIDRRTRSPSGAPVQHVADGLF